MNKSLQRAHVPEWMTKGRATLTQKDPSKGTAPKIYRPITYLPMMWKILTEQFGIEKCTKLVIESGKRHLTDGMELPNQEEIRTLAENEPYKYLGILEADTIKQVEMKNKIQK